MVMAIAEISAALSSLKATMDIVKGAQAAIDRAEIANQLTDVYDKLIAAQAQSLMLQSEHQSLIEMKDNLSKKLMKFERWADTEKEYELHEPDPGSFVYAYKKPDDSAKPKHWLCPNCWEDRIKSILQCDYSHDEGAKYICPRCKAVVSWYHPRPDPSRYQAW